MRKGLIVRDRKLIFDTVLRVLSGNPAPLTAPELAAVLQAAGFPIDPETPKKWPSRGIPERWARRLAGLPRAREAGLTAEWMIEGTGDGPLEGAVLAPERPVATSVAETAAAPLLRQRKRTGEPSGEAAETPSTLRAQARVLLNRLEGLPTDMQRQAVVQAFKRGLEAQDLYGTALFRMAIVMCAELRRLGYTWLATEIEAELARGIARAATDEKGEL